MLSQTLVTVGGAVILVQNRYICSQTPIDSCRNSYMGLISRFTEGSSLHIKPDSSDTWRDSYMSVFFGFTSGTIPPYLVIQLHGLILQEVHNRYMS